MAKIGDGRPPPKVPVVNADKNPAQTRVDEILSKPGRYEITPESKFTIDIYLKEMSGRWVLSNKTDPKAQLEKVVFRIWTYDEMVELKKRSSVYDQSTRSTSVNPDLLNRLKVQLLMVSWTFGESNHRLKIHHTNGIMTDESWAALTKISPTIISYILDMMNIVLENGG
jgi:hypothetical protein